MWLNANGFIECVDQQAWKGARTVQWLYDLLTQSVVNNSPAASVLCFSMHFEGVGMVVFDGVDISGALKSGNIVATVVDCKGGGTILFSLYNSVSCKLSLKDD